MPVTDLDIERWVEQRDGFVPHPFWIAHCTELYVQAVTAGAKGEETALLIAPKKKTTRSSTPSFNTTSGPYTARTLSVLHLPY